MVLAGSLAMLGLSFEAFSTKREEVFFFSLTDVRLGKTKGEARAVAHSEAGEEQFLLELR